MILLLFQYEANISLLFMYCGLGSSQVDCDKEEQCADDSNHDFNCTRGKTNEKNRLQRPCCIGK